MYINHLFSYTIYLADNALILSQRNSEWCGHGPVLEQDIAITNISLDLLGQANNFYAYAARQYNEMSQAEKALVDHLVPVSWKSFQREINEDDIAFLRIENQYQNALITELPRGDWGLTVLRQFFFSAYQFLLYQSLQQSKDTVLAAIAEKSIKEVTYHLRWSSEWVIRLGDGTAESHQRIRQSLTDLWMYTGELFEPAAFETALNGQVFDLNFQEIKEGWLGRVQQVFAEAMLPMPAESWMQRGGKQGRHTEHMGYILAEMQYLQKTYPNVTW